MKRSILAAALALASLSSPATAQGLTAERIAVGLNHPGMLLQAPGDNDRLFILERRRGIRILKNGVLNPGLFLDLTPELGSNEAITSFAFHPDYQNNGRIFVSYMDVNFMSHMTEYLVTSDPDLADPSTRIQLLGPYQQLLPSHNWDYLSFGPDGMLYFGLGDDGQGPNGQDLGSINGKILRMDVDLPAPYVPATGNPFVGQAGANPLIWIYGLRQPWRFDFDPLNGDLYIGEVGAGAEEEIDIVPFASAAATNFGWRCIEGNTCTGYAGCASCSDPGYTSPVYTIPHTGGVCAVIGGMVYRGSAIPSLQGTYWYSEFCTSKIYSFVWDGTQVTQHIDRTAELVPSIGGPVDFVASFSRDHAGELYICSNTGGEVYKIVPTATCGAINYCTSNLNSIGTNATIGFTGTTSVATQDMSVTVSGVLPGKVGLFLYGASQTQLPLGDGFLCVTGGVVRMNPPLVADASGNGSRLVPIAANGITAGSLLNFQYWYRDTASPGTFNLSDGLAVSFCP